ncbi:DUF488 family protein [Clostridium cadaveris]|uniref:DUF488 domain-containing protein n=1 Tax=Clostridium cadaveris TaxID=1529 RepID=UPI0015B7422C|nr:DUF488 domain-containing protein [Clostridium cadaveris]NWK12374.1 DUF488 domain-containing protein [Clostridium cadaveris]
MRIYTIGFTQKTAEQFFSLIQHNNIETVLDVRLNNSSQLAGFAKGRDLKYFLEELVKVNYIHDLTFAPTKEILDNYKSKNIIWVEYEQKYKELLSKRKIEEIVKNKYKGKFDRVCLLCSEAEATNCHRRLVAEIIKDILIDENIEIIHL